MKYEYNYSFLERWMSANEKVDGKQILQAIGSTSNQSLRLYLDRKCPMPVISILRFCNTFHVPISAFIVDKEKYESLKLMNSIYIFNPDKLDEGIFEYKKVYDIKNDIKAMNITPDYGSDIRFIDYNDMLYTLKDINSDNKIRNSYDMYLNANYELSSYLKWEYSKEFLGKKVDYDFMSNYVYVKDNILYRLNYTNEKYPDIYKVSGNYEGEKVIRIYNERILKTDNGFYEIVSYFDKELNKNVTTTMKIKLLTKYYDDVLTFTYKYVILKDYTLIPINDVMLNRVRDYNYSELISGFNNQEEIPKVFEE